MIEFTTVVGLDEEHVGELRETWPTWRKHRPEILEQPLLLVCDGDEPEDRWDEWLSFPQHPNVVRTALTQRGVPQRDRVHTALTLVSARAVRTPWYLKLDTDAVAERPGEWIDDAWFEPDDADGLPPSSPALGDTRSRRTPSLGWTTGPTAWTRSGRSPVSTSDRNRERCWSDTRESRPGASSGTRPGPGTSCRPAETVFPSRRTTHSRGTAPHVVETTIDGCG